MSRSIYSNSNSTWMFRRKSIQIYWLLLGTVKISKVCEFQTSFRVYIVCQVKSWKSWHLFQKFQQLNINRFHSSNFGNAKKRLPGIKVFRRGFRYGPHHVRGEHPLSSLFFEEIFKSRWCGVRMFQTCLELFFSPITRWIPILTSFFKWVETTNQIKVGEDSSNST